LGVAVGLERDGGRRRPSISRPPGPWGLDGIVTESGEWRSRSHIGHEQRGLGEAPSPHKRLFLSLKMAIGRRGAVQIDIGVCRFPGEAPISPGRSPMEERGNSLPRFHELSPISIALRKPKWRFPQANTLALGRRPFELLRAWRFAQTTMSHERDLPNGVPPLPRGMSLSHVGWEIPREIQMAFPKEKCYPKWIGWYRSNGKLCWISE
jgi:hypothetical protein